MSSSGSSSRSFGSSSTKDHHFEVNSKQFNTSSSSEEIAKIININDYLFSFEDVLDEMESRNCFIDYLRNDLSSDGGLFMMAVKSGDSSLGTLKKASTSTLNISNGESKYNSSPLNYYYFMERIGEMSIKKSNTNRLKLAIEIFNDYINEDWNNHETVLDIPQIVREKVIVIFSRLVNEQQEYICPRRVSISSTSKDVSKLAASLIGVSRSRTNSVSQEANSPQAVDNFRNREDSNATNDSVLEIDVFSGDLNEEYDLRTNRSSVSNVDSITVDYFLKDCFMNVFSETISHANYTLKELCFPVFLKCDRFQKLLESKQKDDSLAEYLTKIATLKPVTHQNFIAFAQNVNITSITVEHFALVKFYLFSEDFWSRIRKGKNYEVFTSTDNYRMESESDSAINFFKYEIIFPFNCQKVMGSLLDIENRKQYDKLLKHFEQLDRIPKSDTELSCEITQEVYRMKWPVKDRVFTYCTSSIYDSNSDTYFLCIKSANTTKEKPVKDAVKGLACVCWAFKPIDENTCKYYQLLGIDFKGQVPVKFIHQMMKFRANNYVKDVLEFLKKCEKNGWKKNGANTAVEMMVENGPIDLSIN